MDPFDDTLIWVTRQFHGLRERLTRAEDAVPERCDLAVSSVRVFLAAHRAGRGAGSRKAASSAPGFGSVEVTLANASGQLMAKAVGRRHEIAPNDRPFLCRLPRSGAVLTVVGAEALFKGSPVLRRFVERVAELLDKVVLAGDWERHWTVSLPTGSQSLQADARSDWTQKKELCSALLSHLEELAVNLHLDGQQLRWVWLTRSRGSPHNHQYILYHFPGDEGSPWLMNPGGESGIIHKAIQTGAPSLIWNFADDPDWNLEEGKKKAFLNKVDVGRHPHLLYVPVTRRLAGQICFGPEADPLQILDQAERLRALATTAVNLAFKDAIYFHLAHLPIEKPALDFENIALGSPAANLVSEVFSNLCDMYPVHGISPGSPIPGEAQFCCTDTSDPTALQLMHGANEAAKHAWGTIWAMAHAQRWRDYGLTMLGISHTLNRPLDKMQEYVEQIRTVRSLPAVLQAKSDDMAMFLKQQRVLRKLEKRHLKEVTHSESRSPMPTTVREVLQELDSAGYFGGVPVALGAAEFRCVDPLNAQPLLFRCDHDASYSLPAPSLALMVAELVDNAAAFSATSAADIRRTFGNANAIEVHLATGVVSVTNPVPPEHLPRVVSRLVKSLATRPDRSASKVRGVATIFGAQFAYDTPGDNSLRIKISSHEHATP